MIPNIPASTPQESADDGPFPEFMRRVLRRKVVIPAAAAIACCFLLAAWSPGFPMIYTLLRSTAMWALNGLLLGALFFCSARWLARQPWMPSAWVALGAGGAVAVLGYGAFWIWFAHPIAGIVFSTVVLALGVRLFLRKNCTLEARDREWLGVALTMAIIGVFHLGILHQFGSRLGFHDLAHQRFLDGLGGDNSGPYELAHHLSKGHIPTEPTGGWLLSDRPPLQTGWVMLTWPLASVLQLSGKYVAGTAGVWFQLLWVAAAYGLFRWLGLAANRSLAWCAVLALSGFFLLNTVFTWPKLAGGAFACGAFALWAQPASPHRRAQVLAGSVFAALAWLSHGGVAFSLVALAPWLAWRALRGEIKAWALAAAVFAAFALPWMAFQKFYAPPANRLLKWHLGGQIEIDPRGTWETIRGGYAKLTWDEIIAIKSLNFRMQFDGHWNLLTEFSPQNAPDRRLQEFWHTGAAITWWKIAPGILLLALASRAGRRRVADSSRRCAALAAWTAATLTVWCLLIFLPGTADVLVGSYAMMISLFVLLSVLADSAGRWAIIALAALQAANLFTTWTLRHHNVNGPLSPPALAFAALGGAGLMWLIARSLHNDAPRIAEA